MVHKFRTEWRVVNVSTRDCDGSQCLFVCGEGFQASSPSSFATPSYLLLPMRVCSLECLCSESVVVSRE